MDGQTIALIAGLIPSILTFIYGMVSLYKKTDTAYTSTLEERLKDREAKLAEVSAQVNALERALLAERLKDEEEAKAKALAEEQARKAKELKEKEEAEQDAKL